eukprot:g22755.t1
MRENKYNVLCLGQHLDDFAESFLMSAFRNGALRTMKANYAVAAKDLRVCRPLVNVREKTLANFAKENRTDSARRYVDSYKLYERHRIKLMLSQQEFEHPDLFWSLSSCMKPLMSIAQTEKTMDSLDQSHCQIQDWWRQLMADEDDEDGAPPALTGQVASPPGSPVAKMTKDDPLKLLVVAVASALLGGLFASQELCSAVPQDREKVRSAKAWANYQAFLESPGGKCPHCWLMRRHCCCEGLPKLILRLRVVVLLHHLEIGQRKASNTAKLLAHFGAELLCWGIIDEDMEGTVVLFPSENAVQASELAPERAAPVRPVRQVLVLDGGWRELLGNKWRKRYEQKPGLNMTHD